MLDCVDILGVAVNSGATDDVVRHLDSRMANGDVTRIAFLNSHLSNVAASDRQLRQDLKSFFILNDGIGLDIARYWLHGRRFKTNLNGTDFTSAYLSGTDRSLRIFLLGASESVLQKTAVAVKRLWPRHTVVGVQHGYFGAAGEKALGAAIASAEPDLTLVAMGNPKQERWIAENVPSTCPAAMAVGAWFDFVSDTMPRAPMWVRRLRTEWLYRLFMEPRRLARRYVIGNVVFLLRVVHARMWRGQAA